MQFKKYVCLVLVSVSVNSAVANQADGVSTDSALIEDELAEGKISATVIQTAMGLISSLEGKIATKEKQDSTDSIHLIVMAEKKVAKLKELIGDDAKNNFIVFLGASVLDKALDLINAIDLQEQLLVVENDLEKKAGMESLIKQMREVKLRAVIEQVTESTQLSEITALTKEFMNSPYRVN